MANELEQKLIEAARYSSAGGVKILLTRGVDPNCQDDNGWGPLHWAVSRDAMNVIGLLMANGANPGLRNAEGKSPADLAKELGKADIEAALSK